jgi:hypothetical protein
MTIVCVMCAQAMDMAQEKEGGAKGEDEREHREQPENISTEIIEETLDKEIQEIFRCLNTRKANIDEIKNWCRQHPESFEETQNLFHKVSSLTFFADGE